LSDTPVSGPDTARALLARVLADVRTRP